VSEGILRRASEDKGVLESRYFRPVLVREAHCLEAR
jgi:hypothetical protein